MKASPPSQPIPAALSSIVMLTRSAAMNQRLVRGRSGELTASLYRTWNGLIGDPASAGSLHKGFVAAAGNSRDELPRVLRFLGPKIMNTDAGSDDARLRMPTLEFAID